VLSRVKQLVFGADDPKAGACGTLFDIVRDEKLNHIVEVVSGVMAQDAQILLKEFFTNLREKDQTAGE
jgi:tRNA(adenine34) deaminase